MSPRGSLGLMAYGNTHIVLGCPPVTPCDILTRAFDVGGHWQAPEVICQALMHVTHLAFKISPHIQWAIGLHCNLRVSDPKVAGSSPTSGNMSKVTLNPKLLVGGSQLTPLTEKRFRFNTKTFSTTSYSYELAFLWYAICIENQHILSY